MTDPFIDDSELAIDERTFIAQTKQQGFYVFSGEVALLKEKSHRKPKSKKSALPAPEPIAGPSNYPHVINHSNNHSQPQPQGSKDVPIALLTDEEESVGKRKTRASAESPNGKKKRRVVDLVSVAPIAHPILPLTCPLQLPFHPDLEAAIEDLKVAIKKGVYRPACRRVFTHDMFVFGRELGAEGQVSARNPSNTWICCAQSDQIE